MKTFKLLTVLLFLALGFQVLAQGQRKEEIEAMKTAYITRRINLTPEESKTFWPIYNQFQADLENLRKRRRTEVVNARNDFENMTDKELEKVVDNEIAFRQLELDILKKYHPQFKQVLPIRKVALFYKAEEEFKRELLKRLRENRR